MAVPVRVRGMGSSARVPDNTDGGSRYPCRYDGPLSLVTSRQSKVATTNAGPDSTRTAVEKVLFIYDMPFGSSELSVSASREGNSAY